MTLRRLGVMNRLWKKSPPPHISLAKLSAMVAAYLGVKEEKPPAILPERANEIPTLPDIEE